jgi:hypothetical protein
MSTMSPSFSESPWRAAGTMRRRRAIVVAASVTFCLGASIGVLSPTPVISATSVSANHPYFLAAKVLWESEAEVVSGADQNVPLIAVVSNLQRGLALKHGDVEGYASAIAVIQNFERIPITSESMAQMRKVRSDWSRLNSFFDLTKAQALVLMDDSPSGAYYGAARRAYAKEPPRNRSGVNVEPLKTAVTDLARESVAQPSRSVLYAAAINDLKSLEGASTKDIASSSSSFLDPYYQDTFYLNVFFMTPRLMGPVPRWP